MSELKAEMEFEVGQFVYFRQAAHDLSNTPKKFVVIARMAEQCHGGIQRYYRLAMHDGWISAVALTSEMPPYAPRTQESVLEDLELEEFVKRSTIKAWRERKKRGEWSDE